MNMVYKVSQIDLPADVRAKFPEELGTLKLIKVRTNAECKGKITPRKQNDVVDAKIKRAGCYYCVINKIRKNDADETTVRYIPHQYRWEYKCLLSLETLTDEDLEKCTMCNAYRPKSKWSITVSIKPIDTDIELPSIHYKMIGGRKSEV